MGDILNTVLGRDHSSPCQKNRVIIIIITISYRSDQIRSSNIIVLNGKDKVPEYKKNENNKKW